MRAQISVVLFSITSGFLAIACGGERSGAATPTASSCPPPGTRVPYRKVTSLPQDYVGCDIEVEAQFVGSGWSNQTCLNSPAAGKIQFQVTEPGGNPTAIPLGSFGDMALVAKGGSDAVMAAKPGDKVVLRGGMHFAAWGGPMVAGQGSKCFVAASSKLAQ